MNTTSHLYLSKSRKEHNLHLNDLSYILDIDQSNLSRFEAGKLSHSKALMGYHLLFDLSVQSVIELAFEISSKALIDKCFLLCERIEESPKTLKNQLRLEGINTIISRLMEFEKYDD